MSDKAKSRLQKKWDPLESKYFSQEVSHDQKSKKLKPVSTSPRIEKLPILILSLPFWFAIFKILTNVSPDQIKNFLITNSYLPLTLSVFLALFFTFSFITLNSKIGFLISLFFTILLYLKLINVIFDIYLIIFIFILFLTSLVILLIFSHKNKR